jgi:hypothetical protein
MLGDMRVNRSCAALQRRPAAMGSTMAARFIVPSRAIFPITARCSTAPAVTLGLGLTPPTVTIDLCPRNFCQLHFRSTPITGHLQNRSAARQGRTPANAAACCDKPGSDPTLLRPRSRLPEVRKFGVAPSWSARIEFSRTCAAACSRCAHILISCQSQRKH